MMIHGAKSTGERRRSRINTDSYQILDYDKIISSTKSSALTNIIIDQDLKHYQ